ncbi:MAG: adenosylcobinamide-phosphate synthase CbiB [Pseudomonadota bacterium]
MTFAAALALALALDAMIGWPDGLYRRIGHPVTWIGALVSALEMRWNCGTPNRRKAMGVACVVVVLVPTMVPALVLQWVLPGSVLGVVFGAILAWPWIAARSLYDHIAAVMHPLAGGDLSTARKAVSMIVGRDPSKLDEPGIARAATESLAENTSDGVIAPLIWGLVGGLCGLVAYKAINTLDSMIGHRDARYEDFGKAAARLDDLVNLVPARLTGLVFGIVSRQPATSFQTMIRDAPKHRSPNAGWPEGAMAGALNVRLSGPRVYGDRIADEPWVNTGAPDPDAGALRCALALYVRAVVLCGAGLLALAMI